MLGDSRHRGSPTAGPELLQRAAQAALWNAALLPFISAANLAFAVVIRRAFGLRSGIYDVLLGLLNTLLVYSSVGVPASLPKFLPEIAETSGRAAVWRFLRLTALVRMSCLVVLLVPLNVFAEPIARQLGLEADGRVYFALLSGLALGRAALHLTSQTLNAFFAQQWSNLFALAQVVLDILLTGIVILLGLELTGVVGGLVVSTGVVAAWSLGQAANVVRGIGAESLVARRHAERLSPERDRGRFYRFALFSYLLGFLGVLTDMGFAAPALAFALEPAQVALFATAFKLTFMTVVMVLSGLRGLYQPVFARLRIRSDPQRLQEAFASVSKAQLVGLLPAGLGLVVMSGDYVPLLFGSEFSPAVPIAWVLVLFMYAETALNLPNIILSIDEQYRALFWTQAVAIVAAPLFVITAASVGLMGAAVLLGATRLTTALLGYLVCRRTYGLRFPWRFGARVGVVAMGMAAVLVGARACWPTSPAEAVTLTILGAFVYLLGLKIGRVFGPEELDLIARSGVPGHGWLMAWFGGGRPGVKR